MTYKHICANCKWEYQGNCRRYPPVMMGDSTDALECVWPVVVGCDWCGEFAIANPSERKLVSGDVRTSAFEGKSKLVDIGKWGDSK